MHFFYVEKKGMNFVREKKKNEFCTRKKTEQKQKQKQKRVANKDRKKNNVKCGKHSNK